MIIILLYTDTAIEIDSGVDNLIVSHYFQAMEFVCVELFMHGPTYALYVPVLENKYMVSVLMDLAAAFKMSVLVEEYVNNFFFARGKVKRQV